MLVELSVKDFLDKTAGNDPVPGGGSISALNAAIAASLAEMVANLTVGRKKYEDKEQAMQTVIAEASALREGFVKDIDADSDAYNMVFEAFKLPKETDEEKAQRSARIQEATKVAAEIPLSVARKACQMMDMIAEVAMHGNQNAVTDACVAAMAARTATLGAILNVRINLTSLKDEQYVQQISAEIDAIEKTVVKKEAEILDRVKTILS